jgi:hypothetical protein
MMGVMIEHPPIRQSYAAFTNQGFMLREVSLTADLLRHGSARAEIRREAVEHDLYQIASMASRKTTVNAVLSRLEAVPPSLLEHLAEGSLDLRRLTNLYLVLLQHRLLREFIAEVVLEAFSRFSYLVSQAEVNAFMTHKQHQIPEIDSWSELTRQKSRSTLVNLCVSAGLLHREGEGLSIQPQSVPPALRQELLDAERQLFLRLLLDPEAV